MTLRARTTRPNSLRTRIRRQFDNEDRQQAAVTALFIGLIGIVVVILVGAIALAWYNDNLRPLARVGSVEVGPQLFRNRIALEQWRINIEGNRLTQAQINGEITQEELAAKTSELEQRREALTTTGLDNLVDEIFQSQLAPAEGITVTDADVDARLSEEFAALEKRHVFEIEVKPEVDEDAEEGTPPTGAQQRAALERAEEALAALESGRDFADVAREFSTSESAANGGDLGLITRIGAPDAAFADELFQIESGETTPVVLGADGVYRIGQVTEIQPQGEQAGLREDLLTFVPEPQLRDLLRNQVAAERLQDKITDAQLALTPEQARLAIIYVEGAFTDDPEDAQGEIDYSEIVFAPDDDLEAAPELPEDDPAWEEARAEAQATYDELAGLTGDALKTRFEATATANSDSPTGEDAGAVGFTTRSLPPEAVAAALFDAEHQPTDLIGPIRGDAGYYVLQFHERRDSPQARVDAIKALLAEPDADFAAIAREWSDGPEAEDGGEIGWLTEDQLDETLREAVFSLEPGGVTDALELADEHYFVKVLEKGQRAPDPNQIPDIRANAFSDWYMPKKDAAKADDTIVIAGEVEDETGLEPGED
jgi:parvulin-like peptidyl-prolyl isomerase